MMRTLMFTLSNLPQRPSMSQSAGFPSFSWPKDIPLNIYTPHFVYLPTDGHLGIGAVVNNILINVKRTAHISST